MKLHVYLAGEIHSIGLIK